MLSKCPKFESSGGSEFAELGTDRHAALHAHFKGDDDLLTLLPDEDQEAIRWAAEYIRLKANSDYPIEWETKRTFISRNFNTVEGTPDAVCGFDIFDFKWRPRDYTAQMAAYSLMLLQPRNEGEVTCHLMFGALRKVETIVFDEDTAEQIVFDIAQRIEDPAAKPAPCEYCNWCSKRIVCPAMTGPAAQVAEGYGDGAIGIANWHPSEMKDPEQIALGLTIWRRILKGWGESMEFHALEAAQKSGIALPGYELKERQGKKFVSDTQKAYELSGLPPDKFLKACAVRLNTSKTYPDQLGMDTLFRDRDGGTAAAAKRAVESRLGAVIARGKTSVYLKATGASDDVD
jgi:hypothetical protein